MLTAGLQEWAAACQALGDGRLTLLIRKGGIHERAGGLFVPEHERFVLMPTHLHQDSARVTAAYTADVEANRVPLVPGKIRIELWAEVVRTWRCTDLDGVLALGSELMWTPTEVAKRFAYRDQPWLYVLMLRVYRLPTPVLIPDDPAYAGCRSWLTLASPIDPSGSVPVMDVGRFESRIERVAKGIDA